MESDLIARRESIMDQADRALDAAWPERQGAEYIKVMQSSAKELEGIAVKMKSLDVDQLEQSRTYRYLGSIYSDLSPALGKQMLIKSKEAYQMSENLIEGCDDEFERAKLNFNYGNTLRQIDPNNIPQLKEAEKRFLAARNVFADQAPQFLGQVDTALMSVKNLLDIAPLLATIEHNNNEVEALKEDLISGGNISEIAPKIRKVMNRDGGMAGLIGKTEALISTLPPELKQSDEFAEIKHKLNSLSDMVINGGSMDNQDEHIFNMLRKRLETDLSERKVSADRAETLRGVLGQFGTILSDNKDDVQGLLDKGQRMRDFIATQFESTHYLSHGIPRPPLNSRAAEMVELCWSLRRYLLEEMNRSGKGPEESKEVLELNKQNARVDKRIYEAGDNNARAVTVDQEELRPLALSVRRFSARMHPMIAQPIWSTTRVPVDTTAVFYSGSADLNRRVNKVCNQIGLSVMQAPKGESIANARWKQLQMAMITIFDFGVEGGPTRAAVAYELGIALTLGKPIVVISTKDQSLPFDVDIDPVILYGEPDDEAKLISAIDQAVIWTYPRTNSKKMLNTLDYILSKYRRPHANTYLDQTVKLLEDQHEEPDPLAVNRILMKFIDFLDDERTVLINPIWAPVYPKDDHLSLFHVMPFQPEWADDVSKASRWACEAAGVNYLRGDEAKDPNVIRSIWEEIAQATHIVVDLTGFNANVALELGIIHTLGRNSLVVGQENTVQQLFPMVAKLRVQTYKDINDLSKLVRGFLE